MTLRTITFDDSTHKLVPLEPDHVMVKAALCGRVMPQCCEAIARIHQQMKSDLAVAIAAAPEHQDKSLHRESRNNFVLYKENGKMKLIEISEECVIEHCGDNK